MKHLFDFKEFNVYDQEVTNLSVGAPGPDLLESCCDTFKQATGLRMDYEKDNLSFLFQYGPSQGSIDFRRSLGHFLSKNYESHVDPENLVLTAGASHGIHLILSTLLDPRALIIVDEVTYMIALESFQQFPTMRVISCPLKEDGPDLEELAAILESNRFAPEHGKPFWAMYYTIPAFHNPTGIMFSADVCNQLVALSRKFDFLVACDDVYNLLYYGESAGSPKRIFKLDHCDDASYRGNVISNGTFSKILAPGIRIGWMECPKFIVRLFNNCGVIKSGGAVNHYMSGLIATMIDQGLMQRQLLSYRAVYKTRMDTVCALLKEELPEGLVKFVSPGGGYFVWLQFPQTIDAQEFNDFLTEKYKICGISGSRFSVTGRAKNCLRICVVFHSDTVMDTAARSLCKAVTEYLAEKAV